MIKYLRLYFSFFFSRTTTFILSLVLCFLGSSIFLCSGLLDGYDMMDLFRNEYQNVFFIDSFTIIKMTMVMIAIFTSIILNSNTANNLTKYIIDDRLQKHIIFLSKLILQLFIQFTYIILAVAMYIIISLKYTPYSFAIDELITSSGNIFLLTTFYLCVTNLLMTCCPTILISIFPLVLFWVMEANTNISIIEGSESLKLMFQYIPHPIFRNNQLIILGSIEEYIFSIICITWGNSLFFVKKDIC